MEELKSYWSKISRGTFGLENGVCEDMSTHEHVSRYWWRWFNCDCQQLAGIEWCHVEDVLRLCLIVMACGAREVHVCEAWRL